MPKPAASTAQEAGGAVLSCCLVESHALFKSELANSLSHFLVKKLPDSRTAAKMAVLNCHLLAGGDELAQTQRGHQLLGD